MAPSNIDLIQMADSPIARGDSYVFELDVHVVFRCIKIVSSANAQAWKVLHALGNQLVFRVVYGILRGNEGGATFYQLPSVDLAGRDLEGNDMVLQGWILATREVGQT